MTVILQSSLIEFMHTKDNHLGTQFIWDFCDHYNHKCLIGLGMQHIYHGQFIHTLGLLLRLQGISSKQSEMTPSELLL